MKLPAQPSLSTARLLLKPLGFDDAAKVQEYAGSAEVAATTSSIPHPYPDGAALAWIQTHPILFETGAGAVFGIFQEGQGLIGCIGLGVDRESRNAELGYWIGQPFWSRGYATEAAHIVVAFGFAYFALHKIHAKCMASNLRSVRVLEKIGMRREGLRTEHFHKESTGFHDVAEYGILIRDWNARQVSANGGEAEN